MLRRLRDNEGFEVWSREGRELGRVEDFYLDEDRWTVRYIEVRTGSWFTGRSVLLSPMTIARLDWDRARIDFKLTEDQIKGAPDSDLAQPISRRFEAEYSGYYGIPHYWAGTDLWGMWSTPMDVQAPPAWQPLPSARELPDGQHLRNVREVTGYHIVATDGEIGHVDDYLVDDVSWRIRYLMIDTSNWLGGRTVLLATSKREFINVAQRQAMTGVEFRSAFVCLPESERISLHVGPALECEVAKISVGQRF